MQLEKGDNNLVPTSKEQNMRSLRCSRLITLKVGEGVGHMFLPPVVSTPQVPRKMGSPMHEESVFYKYNIQNNNLLAAIAAFWTFS